MAPGGGFWGPYYRAHGSPFALLEAAANFLGSKPVMLGRGARAMLGRPSSAVMVALGEDAVPGPREKARAGEAQTHRVGRIAKEKREVGSGSVFCARIPPVHNTDGSDDDDDGGGRDRKSTRLNSSHWE